MRRAEPLAGLGGLLLAVSLFLPWYHYATDDAARRALAGLAAQGNLAAPGLAVVTRTEFTAWQAFSVIDILLALVAAPAIAVPIVSLVTKGPAKPVGLELIASVTGLLGVLLVALRLIDAPFDGAELRAGAWLGFAGAVIAWVGSWLSLRDESTPGAVAPEVPRRPAPG